MKKWLLFALVIGICGIINAQNQISCFQSRRKTILCDFEWN
ncbi:MAG: hypothetical protein R2799_15900 [Crocinitomicaceae bacterium]